MKPISYKNSLRVKKARRARSFSDGVTKAILYVSLVLVLSGVAIFYTQFRPLTMLAGVGILGTMFALWVRWDLSKTAGTYNPDSAVIALDEVVTNDIVYKISDKLSPRQLLAAIAGNWQSQFILTRYQVPIKTLMESLSDDIAKSQALWNMAFKIAGEVPIHEISAGVLVVAMMMENPIMHDWLSKNGMDEKEFATM